MTVIKPNAIAGINSITVASGSALAVHKADGTLIQTIAGTSGVSTFSSVSVGSATTTNDAAKSINIGLGASISQHNDNTLTFGTAGDPVAKFDASGQLILGTGTARQKLHINASDSGAANMVFTNTTTGTAAADGFIVGITGGEDAQLNMQESANIKFSTADSLRMTLDSDGRLLLGTTTEGHSNADDLTVATSGNTGITIRSGTSNGGNIFFSDATSGTGEYAGMISYDHNDNIMTFATTDGTERLRIDSSGRLGIGTNNPGQTLHLSAASGDVYNRVDTNVNGGMLIYVQGTQRSVFANDSAFSGTTTDTGIGAKGNLIFRTGTSSFDERIRIGTAGQIGIGGANYGSSGQVLTSQGAGSAVQWATASAGIEMAQHFRLTSSSQGNQSPLTNWEAADNSFAGSLGSSMSVSSGVFTYPSTGIYFCLFTLVGYSDSSTQNLIGFIEQTINGGSNWGNVAYGLNGIYDFSNSYPSWANTATHYIFDITDTSQQKTRFGYGAGQGPEYVKGDTNITYTGVTFIRLGDT